MKKLGVKRNLISSLFLLQLFFVSPVWCEFYQWTDSRGVVHFTDTFHAVPEPVRRSPDLIIHELKESPRWLRKENSLELKIEKPLPEPVVERTTKREKIEPNGEVPTVVHYELEQTNISVGQSGVRFPFKRKHKGLGVFRPDFSSRQYIHPSAFNHRPHKSVRALRFHSRSVFAPNFNSRQYIHPSAFNRRPHKSVRAHRFRSRRR